jgi:hypothetical protein
LHYSTRSRRARMPLGSSEDGAARLCHCPCARWISFSGWTFVVEIWKKKILKKRIGIFWTFENVLRKRQIILWAPFLLVMWLLISSACADFEKRLKLFEKFGRLLLLVVFWF